MFDRLSYAAFRKLANSHKRIAVYKEIPGDRLTPVMAFLALKDSVRDISLLESNPKETNRGRYSHLCFDPIVTIQSYGKNVSIKHNGTTKSVVSDPFDILREYQAKLHANVEHPLSGFIGGMVGFISYDAVRQIERIPDNNEDMDHIPDVLFRFYRHNITFDHQTENVILSTLVDIEGDPERAYRAAMGKLDSISEQLFSYNEKHNDVLLNERSNHNPVVIDTDDDSYCDMVNQAKKNIIEGDILQVVLSRKFCVKISSSAFDVYRALRFSNPSPYMFYIQTDDYAIAGASPEKLISIRSGLIEACALAGTRPRGEQSDDVLANDLLNDEKELAEHMMLVDLARNDLGKVAEPGTVKVTQLKEIEKYTRVMHISSTVQAILRASKDVFDAIKATFPAGTLTGAPKIRAMELIDQLETTRRGIYGGVICGIDSQGNLESCLAIRTAVIKNGVASVRAGAGVVHESSPQAEADETHHKAKAILEGILLAEGERHDIDY